MQLILQKSTVVHSQLTVLIVIRLGLCGIRARWRDHLAGRPLLSKAEFARKAAETRAEAEVAAALFIPPAHFPAIARLALHFYSLQILQLLRPESLR